MQLDCRDRFPFEVLNYPQSFVPDHHHFFIDQLSSQEAILGLTVFGIVGVGPVSDDWSGSVNEEVLSSGIDDEQLFFEVELEKQNSLFQLERNCLDQFSPAIKQ